MNEPTKKSISKTSILRRNGITVDLADLRVKAQRAGTDDDDAMRFRAAANPRAIEVLLDALDEATEKARERDLFWEAFKLKEDNVRLLLRECILGISLTFAEARDIVRSYVGRADSGFIFNGVHFYYSEEENGPVMKSPDGTIQRIDAVEAGDVMDHIGEGLEAMVARLEARIKSKEGS